jgi:hypothetical protein
MTRFSQKQYEWQVLVAVTLLSGFMLFAWPLMRVTTSVPLKLLLALAPAVAMIYLITLAARRIRASDEFEQRTHLIALGFAAAVISTLGLVGGFLSVAGLVTLDGSILMWVFPVIMWSYGAARWYVLRRYGSSSLCDDETSTAFYLRYALLGILIIAIAALSHGVPDYRLGFIYGIGAGCVGAGLVLAVMRWHRRRYRSE